MALTSHFKKLIEAFILTDMPVNQLTHNYFLIVFWLVRAETS